MAFISEIFYSIQGEIDVGRPVIFIRFSGCNLIKEGKGCLFCDTLYAEQGKETKVKDIMKELKKYNCKNIVISGGEPTSQIIELENLIEHLVNDKFNICIETNGTIFSEAVEWGCNSINCSPKKQHIDYNVLKELAKLDKTRFKFVYENKDDLWWEDVINKTGIEKKNVYIMPEGKSRDEQLKRTPEVIEYCKEKGFNFTPRLQVLGYDTRRGV